MSSGNGEYIGSGFSVSNVARTCSLAWDNVRVESFVYIFVVGPVLGFLLVPADRTVLENATDYWLAIITAFAVVAGGVFTHIGLSWIYKRKLDTEEERKPPPDPEVFLACARAAGAFALASTWITSATSLNTLVAFLSAGAILALLLAIIYASENIRKHMTEAQGISDTVMLVSAACAWLIAATLDTDDAAEGVGTASVAGVAALGLLAFAVYEGEDRDSKRTRLTQYVSLGFMTTAVVRICLITPAVIMGKQYTDDNTLMYAFYGSALGVIVIASLIAIFIRARRGRGGGYHTMDIFDTLILAGALIATGATVGWVSATPWCDGRFSGLADTTPALPEHTRVYVTDSKTCMLVASSIHVGIPFAIMLIALFMGLRTVVDGMNKTMFSMGLKLPIIHGVLHAAALATAASLWLVYPVLSRPSVMVHTAGTVVVPPDVLYSPADNSTLTTYTPSENVDGIDMDANTIIIIAAVCTAVLLVVWGIDVLSRQMRGGGSGTSNSSSQPATVLAPIAAATIAISAVFFMTFSGTLIVDAVMSKALEDTVMRSAPVYEYASLLIVTAVEVLLIGIGTRMVAGAKADKIVDVLVTAAGATMLAYTFMNSSSHLHAATGILSFFVFRRLLPSC